MNSCCIQSMLIMKSKQNEDPIKIKLGDFYDYENSTSTITKIS